MNFSLSPYFIKITVNCDKQTIFTRDYSECLNRDMKKDIYGFWHSKGIPIRLNRFSIKKYNYVKTWIVGNGNILLGHYPKPECVCYYNDNKKELRVAYSCCLPENGIQSCDVFEYCIQMSDDEMLESFNNPSVNIFTTCLPQRLTIGGMCHKITFDIRKDSFLWIDENSSIIDNYIPSDTGLPEKTKNLLLVRSKKIVDLYTVVLLSARKEAPTVVVCLGGPYIPVPDFSSSIYKWLVDAGFHVVVPLRRGVYGINSHWEQALKGNYGIVDVHDILQGTNDAIQQCSWINPHNIHLYGGSYGGFSALLIAGKYNQNKLFKSVVSYCGFYNLLEYPVHSGADPLSVMKEYSPSDNISDFYASVTEISPHNYVGNWDVPILLIHTMDDNVSWFGQSVEAYNDALIHSISSITIIIAPGPHSYDIHNGSSLVNEIISFIHNNDCI